MLSLRALPLSGFIGRCLCFFSSAAPNREWLHILDSKYHQLGPLELARPKAVERILGVKAFELDQHIANVEKRRQKLAQAGVAISSSQDYRELPLLEEYLQRYSQLLQALARSPLNNEWIYKTAGWYNARPLLRPLVQRLLASTNEETEYLVDALSWMKIKWETPYGLIDEDLRENRQVENFYRNLSKDFEIQQLRAIEQAIPAPLTLSKRKYYELYVANNLEALLKALQPTDNAAVNTLIWLFHRMVASMGDQEFLINKFEKFLMTPGLAIGEGAEMLLQLYELKGRVNKAVYTQHLKPYLLREKMKDIGGIVECIRFVVCSECGDNALLKSLYELLESKYTRGALQHSHLRYDLHLYTHYLRIKGYSIKLNTDLEAELTHFCKQRAETRENMNRLVYDAQTPSKGKAKFKTKYLSDCLHTKKSLLSEYPATNRSVFEKNFQRKLMQLKLDELQIYEKPVFCCFELDFCLVRPGTGELLDVEIEGMQYVFTSGRFIRRKEIRDEMLAHYGFKVIHVDYNSFKGRDKATEDVALMNKRISDD